MNESYIQGTKYFRGHSCEVYFEVHDGIDGTVLTLDCFDTDPSMNFLSSQRMSTKEGLRDFNYIH